MITLSDMERFGPVLAALFLRRFPDGATREALEAEAETREWARKVLCALEEEARNGGQ